MAKVECLEKLQESLMKRFSSFQFHNAEDGCYISTPFLDASGDAIAIRVNKDTSGYVVDDGGYLGHVAEYVQPKTAAVRRMNESISSITRLFGSELNQDEGTVQIRCAESELAETVLRMLQLIIALDANLAFISDESGMIHAEVGAIQ